MLGETISRSMEQFGEGLRSVAQDFGSSAMAYGRSISDLPTTQPRVVVRAPTGISRNTVSLRTTTKIGLVSFLAGVVVGYMLKQKLRRWVAKMLKRFSD